jgi:type III pantothenate kinase
MLLAIDIGNTNTVVGVFDEDKLVTHFRGASALDQTVDEAGFFVSSLFNHHIKADSSQVTRIAICSVVPHLTGVYEKMSRKYFEVNPLTINSQISLPFAIEYPDPTEIGADRLANVAAGYARYKKALIVVDLGTAVTFDVISETGAYLGGVIAPGPVTAGANLAHRAARLFEVGNEKPDRVIGKTTAGAIKSGLFYGTLGMIDTILEKLFEESGQKSIVIATGGDAETFVTDSKYIVESVPTLTLEGIKIIADFQN